MMINKFKDTSRTMTSSTEISILDFGASTSSANNKVAIQSAINHAQTLSKHPYDIVRVVVPNGLFRVNGTIYAKSNVALVGGGVIKASNNASFDIVDWGGIAVPTGGKTLYAMVGEDGNPIKRSMLGDVVFDYNGENQDVEPSMSYLGISVVHAEDCFLFNTVSENAMYEKIEAIETPDKSQGLCLFIAHAKRTTVIGGRYWKSGYDAIRVAGGAEDTKLTNVFAGKAKRGAIQMTPDSNIVHLDGCTFDNREGGTSTSHALFGHNMRNVYGNNLTLLAKDGYCISFFSDGNTNRVGQSKHVNLKNVVMQNEDERYININSLVEELWVEDVSIEGIALTGDKASKVSGYHPIYLQRVNGVNIKVNIPKSNMNPLFLGRLKNAEIDLNLVSDKPLDYGVSFISGQTVKNIKLKLNVDAPSTLLALKSYGFSDNIRIADSVLNTIDSVDIPSGDTNVMLRDCDFRNVQNADKLRLLLSTDKKMDNVIVA